MLWRSSWCCRPCLWCSRLSASRTPPPAPAPRAPPPPSCSTAPPPPSLTPRPHPSASRHQCTERAPGCQRYAVRTATNSRSSEQMCRRQTRSAHREGRIAKAGGDHMQLQRRTVVHERKWRAARSTSDSTTVCRQLQTVWHRHRAQAQNPIIPYRPYLIYPYMYRFLVYTQKGAML